MNLNTLAYDTRLRRSRNRRRATCHFSEYEGRVQPKSRPFFSSCLKFLKNRACSFPATLHDSIFFIWIHRPPPHHRHPTTSITSWWWEERSRQRVTAHTCERKKRNNGRASARGVFSYLPSSLLRSTMSSTRNKVASGRVRVRSASRCGPFGRLPRRADRLGRGRGTRFREVSHQRTTVGQLGQRIARMYGNAGIKPPPSHLEHMYLLSTSKAFLDLFAHYFLELFR